MIWYYVHLFDRDCYEEVEVDELEPGIYGFPDGSLVFPGINAWRTIGELEEARKAAAVRKVREARRRLRRAEAHKKLVNATSMRNINEKEKI